MIERIISDCATLRYILFQFQFDRSFFSRVSY